MADKLTHIVGIVVKQDPIKRETSKGNVVKFTLRKTNSYEKNDSSFVDVAIWKEELQPVVLSSVYRGQHIVVEGYYKEATGDYYPSVTAFRVGIVDWLKREVVEETTF